MFGALPPSVKTAGSETEIPSALVTMKVEPMARSPLTEMALGMRTVSATLRARGIPSTPEARPAMLMMSELNQSPPMTESIP